MELSTNSNEFANFICSNTPRDSLNISESQFDSDLGLSSSECNYNNNSSKSTPNTSLLISKLAYLSTKDQYQVSKNQNNLKIFPNFGQSGAGHINQNSGTDRLHVVGQNYQLHGQKNTTINNNQRPLSSSSERSNSSSIASSGLGFSPFSLNGSGYKMAAHHPNQMQLSNLTLYNNSNYKQTHKLFRTIHKQTRKRELLQQKVAAQQKALKLDIRSPNVNHLTILEEGVPSVPGVVEKSRNNSQDQSISQTSNSSGLGESQVSLDTLGSHSRKSSGDSLAKKENEINQTPLPELSFIDSKKLWTNMVKRASKNHYQIDAIAHDTKHPQVTSKMRAVLIDWLIDVCQVYQLHRETFHMALDFLARYMASADEPIKRQTLQLVGVTSLFLAAKLEEIHPPKAKDFAYVTDGACTVDQIKDFEMKLCKTLNWNLQPVTAQAWLSLFLQIAQFKKNNINTELLHSYGNSNPMNAFQNEHNSNGNMMDVSQISAISTNSTSITSTSASQSHNLGSKSLSSLDMSLNSIMSPKVNHEHDHKIKYEYHGSYMGQELKYVDSVLTNFQLFRYPQKLFVQMCQLLDFAMMDVRCLRYSYSVLAASTLYHFTSADLVFKCTGFNINDYCSCVEWMSTHAEIVRDRGLAKLKCFQRATPLDHHNIQTHDNNLADLLNILKLAKLQEKQKMKAMELEKLLMVKETLGTAIEPKKVQETKIEMVEKITEEKQENEENNNNNNLASTLTETLTKPLDETSQSSKSHSRSSSKSNNDILESTIKSYQHLKIGN